MDTANRIVSCGYNGVPAGDRNCSDGGCPRGRLTYEQLPPLGDYSNCNGRHAERNAIEYADPDDCVGSTLYVTRAPCDGCSGLVRLAGIVRVVWPDGEENYGLR